MLPLLLALLLAPARAAEAPSRPRLVAVIVVDQMRADYLERFRGRATGGFARFLKDGAVYTQARQLHVPTETCPGHAALSTGEMPDAHGIVGNDWREAAGGDEVYCASDARFNRGPGRLAATALADRLKEADPASKALAISGKDRAAIMLGGHKPDAAIWIDRGGAPTTSGYYGEFPAWAKSAASATPAKPDELDRLTLELALAGLRAMSLGADEHPDLLLLSFSATDYIGHAHGPDSAQIGEDLEALDARLARLFEALDAQAGKGRWAAFLSADHGVARDPRSPQGKAAGSRFLLHDKLVAHAEAAMAAALGPSPAGKWILDIALPHVYLDPKLGPARAKALAAAPKALGSLAEVAEVVVPGKPDGSELACRYRESVYPGRSGDVLLRSKPGLVFVDSETMDSHGTPYDDDARVPLAVIGPGVKAGRYDRPVSVLSLAPSAAKLLGIPFPLRKGREPLAEAFGEKAPGSVAPNSCP